MGKEIIYLDNAATTQIDPEVLDAMMPYLKEHYGNPSSLHMVGRNAKAAIETSRRLIAKCIGAKGTEIYFTSGGTEADNLAICCAINDLGIKHVITSKIEHHAVLHTLQHWEERGAIKLSFVKLDKKGLVDLASLEALLQGNEKSFVSLMHGNNEVANLLDIMAVGTMCEKYGAIFHSDTVQTMGHYAFNLKELPVHFVTGSAHKLHGPKGVGFLYARSDVKFSPLIMGGGQEKGKRGGTECIHGIVGLAKAIELCYEGLSSHQKHIQALKSQMIKGLKEIIPSIEFNGDSESVKSLYTVLNVCLPASIRSDMMLYNFDLQGICASGGSACSSGSSTGSHVLTALGVRSECSTVRFSFGRFNSTDQIVDCLDRIKEIEPLLTAVAK